MCSPPHSQVTEIRANRYKTKGISENHKHSISAGAPWEKKLFKALRTQDPLSPSLANLGVRSPVMGSPSGWGGSHGFQDPPHLGARRPAEGHGQLGGTGRWGFRGAQPSSANQARMFCGWEEHTWSQKTCWPWGKHGKALGKLWKFWEEKYFQEWRRSGKEQKHYQYKNCHGSGSL